MNRSMCAFKFGDRGGRRTGFTPTASQCSSKQFREFPVTIHQQVSLPAEKSFFGVCHIPGYLKKPVFIRMHGKAGKMYPPSRKVHKEQQIVSDQALLRPNPNRCEIYRGKHIPVCAEEFLPVALSLSVRRRINPVCLQYLCNRRIRDAVPEIPYRSPDAVITPARIFLGQLQDQIRNLLRNRGPTRLLPSIAVIPMPGDQLPVPPQNRFRCNDSGNLLKHLATKDLSFDGKAAPLFIIQQDSFLTQASDARFDFQPEGIRLHPAVADSPSRQAPTAATARAATIPSHSPPDLLKNSSLRHR